MIEPRTGYRVVGTDWEVNPLCRLFCLAVIPHLVPYDSVLAFFSLSDHYDTRVAVGLVEAQSPDGGLRQHVGFCVKPFFFPGRGICGAQQLAFRDSVEEAFSLFHKRQACRKRCPYLLPVLCIGRGEYLAVACAEIEVFCLTAKRLQVCGKRQT